MKILLVVILSFLSASHCSNILGFFPTSSISHQVVFHGLMKELASRGHSLTIVTPNVIKSLVENPNVTQIDTNFSYEYFRENINFVEYKDKKMDETELMDLFFPIMMDILEKQLQLPEVKEIILNHEKYKFDALVFEYLWYEPVIAFSKLFDCPAIGITSLDSPRKYHEMIGNEANPVLHPEIMFPFISKRLNFFERWKVFKYFIKETFLERSWHRRYLEIVRNNFPNLTINSVNELYERVDFLMTNTHPALGFVRPMTPKTIQLGFMHIEPPEELPKGELRKFLDEAENGVIYMSFGSNVNSKDLEPKILQLFLNVFKKLKHRVVWKFEAENLPGKPENVMISKWLPQSDLLAHPSIKLFITQGGQQSMEEAIDRAIPMIVIPFLGDQEVNGNRMKQRKIGYPIDLHHLTEEKLEIAITEMLKPAYKENIRKLRELILDQPMSSREKAAWWTEFVIRHKGTKHLDYPLKDVPFYEKYFLDFLSIGFVGLIISYKILSNAFKIIFVKNQKEKIKTQ